MPIPSGVICGYTGLASAIPAGWSRVVALDNRHTRGADPGIGGGGTGGSSSHTHDGTHDHNPMIAHDHPDSRAIDIVSTVAINSAAGALSAATEGHVHTFSGTSTNNDILSTGSTAWTTITQEPPWYGVIWIQSDGTPENIPTNGIVWWNSGTAPTNFVRHTLSGGRYLKGAVGGQNAGATGGSASTHTHTEAASHTHVTTGHSHTLVTTAASATNAVLTGSSSAGDGGHGHAGTTNSATITTGGQDANATPSATSTEPPFIVLLAIVPTVASAPIGIICLWSGSIATIPVGWTLCDGGSGTPDCRSRFAKASSTGTDIGTIGGSATHSHVNTTAHGHTALFHSHSQSLSGTATSTIAIDASGGVASVISAHVHTGVPATTNSPQPPTLVNSVASPAPSVDSRPPYADVLYIQQTAILGVTITAPTTNQVETQPDITVSWTIQAGHTQAQYLVTIYSQDGSTRVYNSGVITSALTSVTVPSGFLHNTKSYQLYVTLWDSAGLGGTAGPIPFSEAFTEPTPPSGVTATAVPLGIPPYNLIEWGAPTVPSGDTFVQFNILRRIFGTTSWITIATSINQALRGYNDYTAAPGTEYEYAVTFTTARGGDPVTSEPQSSPPNAVLTFLGSWIHVVSDPSIYLGYRSNGIKWVQTQDQVGRFAWGRAQPTWHIGSQHWKSGQITEAPDFMPAYGGPTITASQMVDKFLTAQASGAVLCYRFGQTHERYFVIIDASQQNTSRTDDLAMSEQDIMINESFYDESALSV